MNPLILLYLFYEHSCGLREPGQIWTLSCRNYMRKILAAMKPHRESSRNWFLSQQNNRQSCNFYCYCCCCYSYDCCGKHFRWNFGGIFPSCTHSNNRRNRGMYIKLRELKKKKKFLNGERDVITKKIDRWDVVVCCWVLGVSFKVRKNWLVSLESSCVVMRFAGVSIKV